MGNIRRELPTYEVERDVPIPARLIDRFPLDIMMVGDSFTVPAEEIVTVAGAMSYVGINEHKKFIRRRSEDQKTYRIWRVA